MHALLIQFHSDLSGHDLMATLPKSWMDDLLATPGLVMKTFMGTSPNDIGGFYLFATAADAGAYLESPTWQAIAKHAAISEVRVEQFGVVDEPSAACGTPQVRAAKATSALGRPSGRSAES